MILGAECWWNLVPKYYSTLRSAQAFYGWWHGWHSAYNDSDGNPNVFNVNRNDDGLWLNANNGRPDNEWNPENRFVFLRPRKSHHIFCAKPPMRRLYVFLIDTNFSRRYTVWNSVITKTKKQIEEDQILDALASRRDTPEAEFVSHNLAWRF